MTRLQIDSDKRDHVVVIIQAAISSEIKRLELGLAKTNRQIVRFEKEYNISSDHFLRNYTAENMKNGDLGYIQWAGELQIRERIFEDLKNLMDNQNEGVLA
jgi:nuclear transport factor 2 (NTF2) superfamily protein